MLPAPPPYFLVYAATNALLPGGVESGNQSPVEKMPSTFFAPTLLGNSAGSFGPFEKKTNFGLNFSWTSALICAYASLFWVPPTTRSGFFDAYFETIGVMSLVSDE